MTWKNQFRVVSSIYRVLPAILFLMAATTVSAQVCVDSTNSACNEINGVLTIDADSASINMQGLVPAVYFSDESALPGGNDWGLIANSNTADFFSIQDRQTLAHILRVDAGAPENAIRVDSSGLLGLGTGTPAREIHVVSSSTPTVRLEQDNSGGFTPHTWDINGNEDAFSINDETNKTFPFIARPGAPDSSLEIESNGDIGMGTSSATASLHVKRLDGTAKIFVEEATSVGGARVMLELTNKGEPQFRMTHTAAGASWFFTTSGLGNFKLSKAGTGAEELALDGNGNLMLRGNLTACATALAGADTCNPDNSTFPDYVFEPGYPLMPLPEVEQFINEEKHLPNVISADEAAENGINMTQLQLQLLEKVEELTLYTIAQEKELEKSRTYIERLLKEKDRRIRELEQRLDRKDAEFAQRLLLLENLLADKAAN